MSKSLTAPARLPSWALHAPPAVVGHRVAGSQPDGGVVVLQRRTAFPQFGIGVSSAQVGVRIAGVEVDDSAVVLRRAAVLPQLVVQQAPESQGFGVAGVRPDLFRQTHDHPAKALAAQGVHHPAELTLVL